MPRCVICRSDGQMFRESRTRAAQLRRSCAGCQTNGVKKFFIKFGICVTLSDITLEPDASGERRMVPHINSEYSMCVARCNVGTEPSDLPSNVMFSFEFEVICGIHCHSFQMYSCIFSSVVSL